MKINVCFCLQPISLTDSESEYINSKFTAGIEDKESIMKYIFFLLISRNVSTPFLSLKILVNFCLSINLAHLFEKNMWQNGRTFS